MMVSSAITALVGLRDTVHRERLLPDMVLLQVWLALVKQS